MHYSGTGGSVTFLRLDADWEPSALAEVHVTAWNIQDQAVPADVTNCSSEGMRSATMGYTISWSLSFPAYLNDEPDFLSLFTGQTVTMWFKVGTRPTNNYHLLQNTVILLSSPVCNAAGDAVRYTMTGTGGKITYYTANEPSLNPPPVIPAGVSPGMPSPGSTPAASSGSLTYPSSV